jgi:hypothetical protein
MYMLFDTLGRRSTVVEISKKNQDRLKQGHMPKFGQDMQCLKPHSLWGSTLVAVWVRRAKSSPSLQRRNDLGIDVSRRQSRERKPVAEVEVQVCALKYVISEGSNH